MKKLPVLTATGPSMARNLESEPIRSAAHHDDRVTGRLFTP
jgi:hypothetical protein